MVIHLGYGLLHTSSSLPEGEAGNLYPSYLALLQVGFT